MTVHYIEYCCMLCKQGHLIFIYRYFKKLLCGWHCSSTILLFFIVIGYSLCDGCKLLFFRYSFDLLSYFFCFFVLEHHFMKLELWIIDIVSIGHTEGLIHGRTGCWYWFVWCSFPGTPFAIFWPQRITLISRNGSSRCWGQSHWTYLV